MAKLKIKLNGKNGQAEPAPADKPVLPEEQSVAGFTAEDLPTEEQIEEAVKEEEIEESLSEIYQDDKGAMVDVRKMEVKKRHGFFYWLFVVVILGAVAGLAAFYVFEYFKNHKGLDATAVELSIEGREKAKAGEEFFYKIIYKNASGADIANAEIKAVYPDNMIVAETEPASENGGWKLERLPAGAGGEIKVKAKIIAKEGERGVIFAAMNYRPASFSSDFKKEASYETAVSGVGLDFSIAAGSSALAGEENTITIKYKAEEENFLSNFLLTVDPLDNIEISPDSGAAASSEGGNADIAKIRPGTWKIAAAGKTEKEFALKFKFKEKRKDEEGLSLRMEYVGDNQKIYKFFEKSLSYEVIKNNLNLSLIINGSKDDQGIDFEETLNYSIVYANKGEAEMKDVVIMAVLGGDLPDWDTLEDQNNGQMEINTLSWSKEEIPSLAAIKPGEEGVIDFSIKTLPLEKIRTAEGVKNHQIKSFVQFSIGNTPIRDSEDTKSNVIVSRINSNLKLKEEIRYFDQDNIPVGSGPLPPKVGEATTFRAYWKVTNNLHELSGAKVETKLPDYVAWSEKNKATVGTLSFDETERKVVWDIGRLPTSVYEAAAEFNIAITPKEDDRNKILVLLSATAATAVDNETKAEIKKTAPARTTKLEDDDIAASDGIIQ